MKSFILFLFTGLLVISTSLQAETKYERSYSECIAEAGTMNNTIMIGCSEQASVLAKEDITRFYQKIEKKLSLYDDASDLVNTLVSSQKAWINYRDIHCDLSSRLAAQTPYCLMLLNAKRAEELARLAE
ncbi:MAG: lysozyme inhibitor LprI family protein [bacterium]